MFLADSHGFQQEPIKRAGRFSMSSIQTNPALESITLWAQSYPIFQ